MSAATDAGVVPVIFLDEITPPPRPTPDAWIVKIRDGFYIDASYDGDASPTAYPVKHGEAVDFSRLLNFPNSTLTFCENGEWRCEPPAPAGAESVMAVGDVDTATDSVSELAALLDGDGGGEPGQEYLLAFYSWTDEVWSFDAEAGKFTRGAA